MSIVLNVDKNRNSILINRQKSVTQLLTLIDFDWHVSKYEKDDLRLKTYTLFDGLACNTCGLFLSCIFFTHFEKIAHMSVVWAFASLWLCIFGCLLQGPIRLKVVWVDAEEPIRFWYLTVNRYCLRSNKGTWSPPSWFFTIFTSFITAKDV